MTSGDVVESASYLAYEVDDRSPYGNLENDLDLATAPGYKLFFSCFMGDVDLSINGIDFRTHIGWVSTLSFAMSMLRSVRDLPAQGESSAGFLESEDRIEFRLDGTEVRVSCTYSESVATIAYDELLRLVQDALSALLRKLYADYPGLAGNPSLLNALAQVGVAGD